jgi:hypothetical protein
VFQAVLQSLIRENVQLLLFLALNVLNARGPENVHQACAPDGGSDDLGCQADVIQKVGQLPRRLRIAVFLIEDEPLDGGDV